MNRSRLIAVMAISTSLFISACSDDDNDNAAIPEVDAPEQDQTPDAPDELVVPDNYSFASQFDATQSSVSYSGQTMRHVLINDLNIYINEQLQASIDLGDFTGSTKEDVLQAFDFYYEFEDSSAEVQLLTETTPTAVQTKYGDVSLDKNLIGKLAGNDALGQHKDWNAGAFVGIGAAGDFTPTTYMDSLFDELADNVMTVVGGDQRLNVLGEPMPIYVTSDGRDLKQLIQKFLLGGVGFSQSADDYLDDDTEGKGLNSDNTVADGDSAYTALEHAWDEGFGYFGGARNYLDFTDEELAESGGRPEYQKYNDADADARIDLKSEFNFGISVNAGKRDIGAAEGAAPTDFSTAIMQAFLTGRAIIANAGGALSDEDMVALQEQRDIIVDNWEKVIAATVVHYLNDMLQDINAITSVDGGSYNNYAKHWSEMKGFALSFQFNPRSPMSDEAFAQFHQMVGDAPVLPDAEGVTEAMVADYQQAILNARAMVAEAYEFDPANVGDDDGLNGW